LAIKSALWGTPSSDEYGTNSLPNLKKPGIINSIWSFATSNFGSGNATANNQTTEVVELAKNETNSNNSTLSTVVSAISEVLNFAKNTTVKSVSYLGSAYELLGGKARAVKDYATTKFYGLTADTPNPENIEKNNQKYIEGLEKELQNSLSAKARLEGEIKELEESSKQTKEDINSELNQNAEAIKTDSSNDSEISKIFLEIDGIETDAETLAQKYQIRILEENNSFEDFDKINSKQILEELKQINYAVSAKLKEIESIFEKKNITKDEGKKNLADITTKAAFIKQKLESAKIKLLENSSLLNKRELFEKAKQAELDSLAQNEEAKLATKQAELSQELAKIEVTEAELEAKKQFMQEFPGESIGSKQSIINNLKSVIESDTNTLGDIKESQVRKDEIKLTNECRELGVLYDEALKKQKDIAAKMRSADQLLKNKKIELTQSQAAVNPVKAQYLREIKSVEDAIAKIRQNIDSAKIAISTRNANIVELSEQSDNIQTEINKAYSMERETEDDSEKANLAKQIADLEKEKIQIIQSIGAEKGSNSADERKTRSLASEIEKKEKQLSQIKQAETAAIKVLEDGVSKLIDEISNIENKIESLKNTNNALKEELGEYERSIVNKRAELTEIVSLINEQDEEITQLEAKIKKNQDSLKFWKNEKDNSPALEDSTKAEDSASLNAEEVSLPPQEDSIIAAGQDGPNNNPTENLAP